MSQQRATEQNAASSNNNGDVITVDDDDEDEDVQFVGIVRPSTTIIDLCLSPSTSAAAAAARSGNGSADDAGTGSESGAAAPTSAPNSPASSAGDAAKADVDAGEKIGAGQDPNLTLSHLRKVFRFNNIIIKKVHRIFFIRLSQYQNFIDTTHTFTIIGKTKAIFTKIIDLFANVTKLQSSF